MTHIQGYGTITEAECRRERYKELKAQFAVQVEQIGIGNASVRKQVTFPDNADVSEIDALIYADDGNSCFGGRVQRNGNKFTCDIYTD